VSDSPAVDRDGIKATKANVVMVNSVFFILGFLGFIVVFLSDKVLNLI
jgi:hypothetical protein